MPDTIDGAVERCLKELGFASPDYSRKFDVSSPIGNYMLMEEYSPNMDGVSMIKWTTGYERDDGKTSISKVVVSFNRYDVDAGLTVFPDKKDEKPTPYSNGNKLGNDLRNMFEKLKAASPIDDYLTTVYNQLRDYAQPIVPKRHNRKPDAHGALS